MILAKRNIDVSPMNFIESRRQKRLAKSIGIKIAEAELSLPEQGTT